ncbi:unnamed protein product [Alternaria alternata]
METSQAVMTQPRELPSRSRPGEPYGLLPSLSAHVYEPIDSENGEIRLLELLPGCYHDVIRINLHTKNLNDNPNYEALSYAWGTAPSSNPAIINGCPIPVRESLDLGLRRLRLTDESRTLWVDALCINQSDVQERSHQVQQMCMIYKSAEKVVIWLGEWPDVDICLDFRECRIRCARLLFDGSPVDLTCHQLEHVLEISKLPWFRRLWIIQEYLLPSPCPAIMLGNDIRMSSRAFCDVIIICLRNLAVDSAATESEREQANHQRTTLLNFQLMKNSFDTTSGASLYEYLALSRRAIATDPRDRIYGLLGMVKSYVADPILPDYSKAWPQVLAEATMVMISEDGLFPYMSEGFVFPSTEEPEEGYRTPSWVLDLTQRIRSDVLRYSKHHSEYSGHRLDSEGTERRRRSLRLSDDFRTLYKHGRHVGTIKSIFVSAPSSDDTGGFGQNDRENDAGLHDFYHQILKPNGVAPGHLYEAIHSRLLSRYNLYSFVSSLQDRRDRFCSRRRLSGGMDKFAVFLTDEGDVGATWLSNSFEIRADDMIVALFERRMPFILRPVPGHSTYRMVNLAYIPGLSGTYIQFHSDVTRGNLDKVEQVPDDWIHDAAEGCLEYAIV